MLFRAEISLYGFCGNRFVDYLKYYSVIENIMMIKCPFHSNLMYKIENNTASCYTLSGNIPCYLSDHILLV